MSKNSTTAPRPAHAAIVAAFDAAAAASAAYGTARFEGARPEVLAAAATAVETARLYDALADADALPDDLSDDGSCGF